VIEQLSAQDERAWDAFVLGHSHGTFFHLAAWKHVIERALGHRTHYLVAKPGSAERNAIVGVLPLVEIKSMLFGHALISNAFCVAGGPLGTNIDVETELLAEASAIARRLKVDYVELKDFSGSHEAWLKRENLYAGFERPIANDETACLTQIPRKQRAVVRKSLEQGFLVTIDEDVDTLFNLYALTVRDHGTPVFPRRLFECLKETFGTACEISSVMSFYFRDRVMPYYTGSIREARQTGANDFMYWRLMRRANERGMKIFDFGRSKIETGPFAFKKNWGFPPRAMTHQFFLNQRKSLPNLNPTNPKFDLLVKAWRRMPLPLANLIGPLISRNLG
jgi:FemAB-related protein (PEP-CTERM system-associated)